MSTPTNAHTHGSSKEISKEIITPLPLLSSSFLSSPSSTQHHHLCNSPPSRLFSHHPGRPPPPPRANLLPCLFCSGLFPAKAPVRQQRARHVHASHRLVGSELTMLRARHAGERALVMRECGRVTGDRARGSSPGPTPLLRPHPSLSARSPLPPPSSPVSPPSLSLSLRTRSRACC